MGVKSRVPIMMEAMTKALGLGDTFPDGPWDRAGRGRSFEVFATEQDLDSWLAELPEFRAPYELFRVDLVPDRAGRYKETPIRCPGVSISTCGTESEDSWNFWLRASGVGPEVADLDIGDLVRLLSYNGFINIQHGRRHRDAEDATSFGLVDRLANQATGETRIHHDHLRVYRHLVRRAKRDVVCTSLWQTSDGLREDTRVGFTQRALDRYRLGHQYVATPSIEG